MTTNTAGLDALGALKRGSRDVHLELERTIPLLDSNLTLPTYRTFLEAMWGTYAGLEAEIVAQARRQRWNGLPDIGQRSKLGWLRQDLRALGLSEAEIAALPRPKDVPELDNTGRLWGCLYVLEGSTLGGQVLTRHVGAALNLDPDTGLRFLSAYGRDTGPMWNRFRKNLSQEIEMASKLIEAESAAVDTFQLFLDWMRIHFPDRRAQKRR